jgi:hypothetical protein
MSDRKFSQQESSGACELNDNLSAIFFALRARNSAETLQAVYQLNGTVMLEPQSVGQFADGGLFSRWEPSDGEQQLMLLRLKSISSSLPFAEEEKFSDLVSEFS